MNLKVWNRKVIKDNKEYSIALIENNINDRNSFIKISCVEDDYTDEVLYKTMDDYQDQPWEVETHGFKKMVINSFLLELEDDFKPYILN